MSTAAPADSGNRIISSAEERRVIIASSVGTVFEWYDFYLYAILAPFFAALFFPPGNQTAALLGAFGAYAAGFLVRPFGALIFGRVGDLVGRKYTFLVTISVMGLSTVLVGFLPTYQSIGFSAAFLLVALRLAQGLALGGEYGGAATYVAEHAPDHRRGYATSWIQTTATVGMLVSLVIILICRVSMSADAFKLWGWRIPFWLSIPLLIISIYIRFKLQESPIFQRMKAQGKRSKSPIKDSFFKYPNNKYAALALFGATAGQGVVWYTGQFYALFFILIYLKLDFVSTYLLIGLSLLIGTPFFLVFGSLSDKIGRKKIILAGCLIAALTYIPLFKGLTHYINPDLETYQANTKISVAATNCSFHLFVMPTTVFTPCDKVKDYLGKNGLSFESVPAESGKDVVTTIGNLPPIEGWDAAKFAGAMKATNYPTKADHAKVNWFMAELILVIMLVYVTMVYGPIAAFLVELFPANIRYTSMSLPYHIGNGWFGGMLPLIATAWVAESGSIYQGLWYPIIVAAMTVVVGALFLRETKDVKIHEEV
ncbi:MAG TPA: MFS transporter [Thermoanaerobaculia bacterium]|nr:MFS transporter [Thermoanaerobaculia bacterium]